MTIATSAFFAIAAACAGSDASSHSTLTPGPAASRMPWSALTKYGGVPLYQSRSTWSAHGPITAMVLSLARSSGSVWLSFLSSTIDSSVASRASFLLASWSHGGSEASAGFTFCPAGCLPISP